MGIFIKVLAHPSVKKKACKVTCFTDASLHLQTTAIIKYWSLRAEFILEHLATANM